MNNSSNPQGMAITLAIALRVITGDMNKVRTFSAQTHVLRQQDYSYLNFDLRFYDNSGRLSQVHFSSLSKFVRARPLSQSRSSLVSRDQSIYKAQCSNTGAY